MDGVAWQPDPADERMIPYPKETGPTPEAYDSVCRAYWKRLNKCYELEDQIKSLKEVISLLQKGDNTLSLYDHLSPAKAVAAAWTIEGRAPVYHKNYIEKLRIEWPLLHRAITRLVEQETSNDRET